LDDESPSFDFTDLLRVKVFDAKGRHMGHVQDLAIESPPSAPRITHVGVHLSWTDRVGDIMLVRRTEDVVLLLPWSEVTGFGPDAFRIGGEHPELRVETAADRLLLRRDVLDKQMTDREGNRLQRVDDVLIEKGPDSPVVAGLKVSTGMLVASPGLRRRIEMLKRRFKSKYDIEVIPWEAIQAIDKEYIVIAT
jgi:sporulation protein YlmC with PRC-barrel domain